LTRPSWSRAELNDIAADMEMMLDGALERVNEAALDRLDARIADGDDPIEIAQDLLESTIA
jgi:TerB-C domain